METVPTVLKDSKSLVQLLEDTVIPDENCWLITADVESLYTNIPTREGIEYMKQFLSNCELPTAKVTLFIRLLTLVLENNYLQFLEEYYKQIDGTAMGTPVAVVFANIFMYMLEKHVIEHFKDHIFLYKRFLDDLLMILKESAPVETILSSFNSMHPQIKMNFQVSKSEAEFLDLRIFKGPRFYSSGILDLQVHQKMLNLYLYIPYCSYHTKHTKIGFITTELQRYVRNTSSFAKCLEIRKRFFLRLRARGYPPKFLQWCFRKVSYNQRHDLLQPKANKAPDNSRPLVFLTSLNPLSNVLPIKSILNHQHWGTIEQDQSLKAIFPSRPIIGYKRERNLKELICKGV